MRNSVKLTSLLLAGLTFSSVSFADTETPAAPTKPSYAPTTEQFTALKKLVKKLDALNAAQDTANTNEEEKKEASEDLKVLKEKLAANTTVKALYDYYVSLTDEGRTAYEAESTAFTATNYKSALEVGTVKVAGDKLITLRAKRYAYTQAVAAQETSVDKLTTQLSSAVTLFEEVTKLFDNEKLKTTTETEEPKVTEAKQQAEKDKAAFAAKVAALKSSVNGLVLGDYVTDTEATVDTDSVKAVYDAVTAAEETATVADPAPSTTPAPSASTEVLLAAALLEDNGSASQTTAASVAAATAVVDSFLTNNPDNEELKALKTKLEALQTALEAAAKATETSATAVETAKKDLVDYATGLGIEADTATTNGGTATTVFDKVLAALATEGNTSSFLAGIVAQRAFEAKYNKAAAKYVLSSLGATAHLHQQRGLLDAASTKGYFFKFFYNNQSTTDLSAHYPTFVFGGNYNVADNTKLGGAVTFATGTLSESLNSTSVTDTAVGVNVFANYAFSDYYTTLLLGYTHHQVKASTAVSGGESFGAVDAALKFGYNFTVAEKYKASVAGLYQFNNYGYTSLATHLVGAFGDLSYAYNGFDFSFGAGVYYQAHSKDLPVAPAYTVQVTTSGFKNFAPEYTKSGVGAELSFGFKTKFDETSGFGLKASYNREPRKGNNYNLNFDYKFKL